MGLSVVNGYDWFEVGEVSLKKRKQPSVKCRQEGGKRQAQLLRVYFPLSPDFTRCYLLLPLLNSQRTLLGRLLSYLRMELL